MVWGDKAGWKRFLSESHYRASGSKNLDFANFIFGCSRQKTLTYIDCFKGFPRKK
jgi:hypothetical protein